MIKETKIVWRYNLLRHYFWKIMAIEEAVTTTEKGGSRAMFTEDLNKIKIENL